MALMDESAWRGRIFLGGWTAGGGGDAAVTEPATGQEIGRVGLATPDDVARAAPGAAGGRGGVGLAPPHDVARAAQVAAAAQVGWAARPHTERQAILRRAGDLWLAAAAGREAWGSRERGEIPP